jgi:hypothetical protein
VTDCRVIIGTPPTAPRFAGSGFVIAGGSALTAHHVVRGRPAHEITIETIDRERIPVRRIDADDALDVAVLQLQRIPVSRMRAGTAEAGTTWVVTTGPQGNDPQLSGSVTAVERAIVNDGGHSVSALQLEVSEALEDFAGYSGSAVRLASEPDVVIGMLCEQVQTRLKVPGAGKPRATNVLYAVPISLIVHRFGLAVPAAPLPWTRVFRRIAQLIDSDELTTADRELDRMPGAVRDRADFWYWRARVAIARHNLEVAAAYLDEALRQDPRHSVSIAARIRLLLIRNDEADRVAAQRLAERSTAISDALDTWLACLQEQGLYAPGIRSGTEFDARCPFPEHD